MHLGSGSAIRILLYFGRNIRACVTSSHTLDIRPYFPYELKRPHKEGQIYFASGYSNGSNHGT